MTHSINPRHIAKILGIAACYLALQSLVGEYLLQNVLGDESNSAVVTLIDLLSVNVEESIPTWFSTLLLFVASGLLFFIAAVKRQRQHEFANHWLGLALTFLYLSMDEGAAIHETAVDPLANYFNTSGYLTFAWQILFLPLAILFALLYIRFLRHLSAHERNLFIASGLIYVGGAVFIEGISANQWAIGGVSFTYLAIATVEELCEMLGIVLFIYTLLTYIEVRHYTAVFDVISKPQPLPYATKPFQAAAAMIVALNLILFLWVFALPGTEAVAERPFTETIAANYQGVIIMQLPTPITDGNDDTTRALRTLFPDVLIVTLPDQNKSIALASQALPFNEATLTQILHQSGETNFTIDD